MRTGRAWSWYRSLNILEEKRDGARMVKMTPSKMRRPSPSCPPERVGSIYPARSAISAPSPPPLTSLPAANVTLLRIKTLIVLIATALRDSHAMEGRRETLFFSLSPKLSSLGCSCKCLDARN